MARHVTAAMEDKKEDVSAILSRLARRVNNFYMEGFGAETYAPFFCGPVQVYRAEQPITS